MSEPTYKIAQRLHARRAAVGLPKYGQHLTADSPGCMIVHALEEAADLTEYLLAEVQRRKIVLETLNELSKEMHAELAIGWAYEIEKLYDLLGGKSAIEKSDEILGTVAENATVAPEPHDDTLDTVEMALRNIHAGATNHYFVKDNASAGLEALKRYKDALCGATRTSATRRCWRRWRGSDMPRLEIGKWPDRKRPILTVCNDGENRSYVLAYFVNEEAAKKFVELVKTGIVFEEEEGEKDGRD